jgi:uncharacterized protein
LIQAIWADDMSGLLALLDDVVAISKVAAASLDDVLAQTAKAGSKAAGIVIDDAAVTPRYVVGFAAERELPIVARIAWGSIKNKLVYLLPAALLLSALAPWAITPLLMIGGAFLCFEGYEKVHGWLHPEAEDHPAGGGAPAQNAPALGARALGARAPEPREFEDEKIAGAIRTDMILSAEIMAISLASIESTSVVTQAVTLAMVALLITVAVYGAVALIVKADDIGIALAQSRRPVSGLADVVRRREATSEPTAADQRLAPISQSIGRGLVLGMPPFLRVLSVVGTLAMLWVGGGIIVHGLAHYGLSGVEHGIESFGRAVGAWLPLIGGLVSWFIAAAIAGVVGLAIGWVVEKGVHTVKA